MMLFGCGSEPVRRPPSSEPPAPHSGAVVPTPQVAPGNRVRDEKGYLQSLYADPRLDPIRNKVPLQLRADSVSAGYLRIDTKPTQTEKRAIKAWLQVREQAQQYQASLRGAPSPALQQTRTRVTQAITQLYSGKLTYAAFARRVQQIDAEHQAAR
jgi:hypothetical protein